MVFVFNKDGTKLMPCHPAKARILLKKKLAKIVKYFPFIIKLKYQIQKPKYQDVTIGIDPGKTIGISITTKQRVLFEAQLEQRTNISKLLEARKNARRARRARLRYRPVRWQNRKKIYKKQKDGWIPPSIQASLLIYVNIVKFFNKYVNINKVIYEYNAFDVARLKKYSIFQFDNDNVLFQTLNNNCHQNLSNEQNLYKANMKTFVRERDNYTCQLCKKSLNTLKKDNIKLQVHHILPTSQGGTTVPDNLVTLCECCHKKVHEYLKLNKKVKFKIKEYKENTRLNILKDRIYNELINLKYDVDSRVCLDVKDVLAQSKIEKTYGYETKIKRVQLGLEKDHHIDARIIANGCMKRSNYDDKVYLMKKIRNHNRKIYQDKTYKGNRKQRSQCSYIMFNFRRYDIVQYQGKICYINSLRSTGWFELKQMNSFLNTDIDGNVNKIIKNDKELIDSCNKIDKNNKNSVSIYKKIDNFCKKTNKNNKETNTFSQKMRNFCERSNNFCKKIDKNDKKTKKITCNYKKMGLRQKRGKYIFG